VVYVSDVDVSIIDKTATLLSLMDPSVPSPLYGLASIHVVYVSPVDVDVSIIDRTATLPSSMGPPVLLPLFVRPRGLTLSRSRSPNAVLTASGWMDGWMDDGWMDGFLLLLLLPVVVSRIFGLESEDSSLLAIFEGERKDLSL
jgi:hypothetical protein